MSLIYNNALNKIYSTIEKHSLICEGDKVLVALSGGSDSVFLLHALHNLSKKHNFSVSAAHLNHSLRPEADEEEHFVLDLCSSLGIPCRTKTSDIKKISEKQRISEETAGRNERYAFFKALSDELGYTKLATAHHLDDNAETILMHFIRGSGTKGMGGIEYKHGNIIRPLLDFTKEEITEICESMHFDYVTDKSNFDTAYTRNRLRLKLIPEIKKYNPAFSQIITKNAILFSEDNDFLEKYAYNIFEKHFDGSFPRSVLDKEHIAVKRRIIQLMFQKESGSAYNLPQKYINAVLSLKKTGQMISLPCKTVAILEYGNLSIRKKDSGTCEYEYKLNIDEELFIPECGIYLKVIKTTDESKKSFVLPDKFSLTVRNRRNGDLFYPIGLEGKKTLSNFFTDKKFPCSYRDTVPLLTSNGEIINIGGAYRDRRYYHAGGSQNRYRLEIRNKE